ncbi:MAG: TRAP transporter large permease [Burkholderiaceae bacterium]
MTNLEIGLIFTGLMMVMLFAGMRVAFAAAFSGTFGLIAILAQRMDLERAINAALGIAGTVPHSKAVTYALSVLPMFILIGFLAFHAGITKALFEAAKRWFGRLPGGMAVGTVFATAGFAAVSGASTATAAVFSRVAIPEMLKEGYDKRLASGVVAAGGTLATLIPPSAILVIYAIIVEESVGKLLLAGFLPGIVSAIIYAGIIIFTVMMKPESGPPSRIYSWKERASSLPGTFPIIGVIFIIFGSMYFGWATPTEAGALGAFVVFVLAMIRGMPSSALKEALIETSKLTVMIFTIIWGVLIYVRFLGFAGLPQAFASWIDSLPYSPLTILICILLVYAILGMFMDAIGMLMLTLPVVHPAIVVLGYDTIWFGIIVVKMVELCLITPPIGLNCFVVSGVVPEIKVQDVFRGCFPFFVADVLTVAVLIAFPQIVLIIPNMMSG